MVARAVMLALLLSVPEVWALKSLVDSVADYVGVPGEILYAIALAESGITVEGKRTPWPWSLNVAGDPRRYENREALFDDLMTVLGEGTLRVDIGPMQLNWYWQYEHVGSPWRLTDPSENIKLAAQLLKQHYERCGDWWEAVGLYHRPAQRDADRVIAQRYRERVRRFVTPSIGEDGAPNAP